ncbi:transmembrane ascorbate-dependent reductase CYB561-like [Lytechinus pictus]|uniref:transmembrane ascorbate-dependent reductase CYB561-like n=1 Tax=Lytechinus pictus TaxID=7653 RepID=UPI0030BA29AC
MIFVLIVIAEVLCVLAVVLVGVWMGVYRGGVAWDGTTSEFNLHPIMMTLGLIVFNGNALMLYRACRETPKAWVKAAHVIFHCLALFCACLALVAVWQYHNANGIPNVYSIHSWIGITVFIMYVIQWFIGLSIFAFPCASLQHRDRYKPLHVFFGVFLFGGACATALIGIEDKLMLAISTTYSSRPPEAYVANFLGLVILFLAAVVTFVVTFAPWKRPDDIQSEWQPIVSSTPARDLNLQPSDI